MLDVLPTHSFGDVDHLVIQIFALCVRCRLVLQRWPHCSTVCKVTTAPLLQTKVALSPRALPKLHGLYHQHCHPIKGLLSLLLTHHFLVMDVDCCLTCTSFIPIIIWFIVLALGLFKSPFHICDRLTDGLPHALSSALLLFHACPWKCLPQSRHSFSSKGPTPSLSVGWLVATHAVRLTDSHWRQTPSFLIIKETHSFLCLLFIVDTQLPLCMATHAD